MLLPVGVETNAQQRKRDGAPFYNALIYYSPFDAPRVNDIVLGKRGITADTAMRLGAYFGCPAQLWLGLQMDHDLWLAAKNKSLAKVKPRARAA